ncbi:hypothetical protein R75465_00686 [Paraburkholderia aspalathi]|nr:hypothetical protein R75465_00686 [Paraburkholderia aspalathi]
MVTAACFRTTSAAAASTCNQASRIAARGARSATTSRRAEISDFAPPVSLLSARAGGTASFVSVAIAFAASPNSSSTSLNFSLRSERTIPGSSLRTIRSSASTVPGHASASTTLATKVSQSTYVPMRSRGQARSDRCQRMPTMSRCIVVAKILAAIACKTTFGVCCLRSFRQQIDGTISSTPSRRSFEIPLSFLREHRQ